MNVSVKDGRVLVSCQAGCSQDQVLDALRLRALWPERQNAGDNRRRRLEAVLRETIVDDGTIANYLRSRGLSGDVPPKLRLYRMLGYYNEQRQPESHHPAIVAPVQAIDGRVVNLHRTYLAPAGQGKADVPKPKKLMAAIEDGATRGGAIHLAEPTDTLALAEGIETALAVFEATGTPSWATVSAGGLEAVEVPAQVRHVEIFADNDANGAGQRAADAAAKRLRLKGYEVAVLLPVQVDTDWLDVLANAGPEALRDAKERQADIHGDVAYKGESGALSIGLVRLSDVRPERVRWLWPGRIPLGKVSLIDGDPGLGKSVMTLDIGARVTKGRAMPDGASSDVAGPAGVVLLTAEDGLGDTVRPRLEAAGADLGRVQALEWVGDGEDRRMPTLADIDALEAAIVETGARLAIIDPLMAYLPGAVNSFRDQDVRRLLAPLAALAERTGAAIVVIRHLTKAVGGSPIYRGGGSIGIIGAARSALLVAKDPDDPDGRHRILVATKCNLAVEPQALAYHLETALGAIVPHIVWEGATNHTAAGLLTAPTDEAERNATQEAVDVLQDILASGPVPANDVRKAARAAGVADRTLDRAKATLGVKAKREGFGEAGVWYWSVPIERQENSKSANSAYMENLASFGEVGALSNGHAPPGAAEPAEGVSTWTS